MPTPEPTADAPVVGVRFDPIAGRLSSPDGALSLAARGGNRAVWEAYLALVEAARPDDAAPPVVLDADLDALVVALDLGDPDLVEVTESALGASADDAIELLARLQAHRVLGGGG